MTAQHAHQPSGDIISELRFGEIDRSKLFLPEELTHLFYAPVYAELSHAHRLRYNQLFAFYMNELTIFFETRVAPYYLRLADGSYLCSTAGANLRRFVAEEANHAEMFRRLNRAAAPELYPSGDFYFLRMPSARWESAFGRISLYLAPAIVLLGTIQEERVTRYGDRYHAGIEPNFLSACAAHCGEECAHIDFGATLLKPLWFERPRLQRYINRVLFQILVKEFFLAPKRGGMRILARLISEHPELRPLTARLRAELLGLSRDRKFLSFLYSRETVPESMKFFDRCDDLKCLSSVFPGYVPR